MADEKIILLDTSILIDYYRKKDKSKTHFIQLASTGGSFRVSAVTHFEIYTGASDTQKAFWDDLFRSVPVIPFDIPVSNVAVLINKKLKQKSKQIDKADLFIAATAIAQKIPLATLNKKHFERIDELILIA